VVLAVAMYACRWVLVLLVLAAVYLCSLATVAT
jgi:hypothetical protein